MKIAVTAGYWSSGPPAGAAELFEAADRAGVDQIWTAEAYGSDAWTPLAWWGSRTQHVKLGTAVSQLSARPPVTLAAARRVGEELSPEFASMTAERRSGDLLPEHLVAQQAPEGVHVLSNGGGPS